MRIELTAKGKAVAELLKEYPELSLDQACDLVEGIMEQLNDLDTSA